MRFLIQCVDEASVQVDRNVTGAIEKGFLVLIGISDTDDTQIADRMIKKMLGLRIFEDENHKTNLSLSDVEGSLLLVSDLHFMLIVRKEIVLPLSGQENRSMPTSYMNTSLNRPDSPCPTCRPVFSELI